MSAEQFFPLVALTSLLLYLISGMHALPPGARIWSFRIAVALIGFGVIFALIGTVFWYMDGPRPDPSPARSGQVNLFFETSSSRLS